MLSARYRQNRREKLNTRAEFFARQDGGMGEALDSTETFREYWREAVQQYADRPAVRDDERVLSYTEFDALQAEIGAAVAARVPVGGVVGIVVPKRVWSLVAMFGVINAARTALLLDPDDPPERWQQHCTRVDATFGLAEAADRHDAVRAAGLVPLGADDVDTDASVPDDPIDLGADSWIICTSGSTGVPKLVGIPQRMMAEAWVRNIERNRYYGDLGASVLVLPPLWSAAIRMATIQALCGGACAVLVDTASTPPTRVLSLIEEHDVRRVHLGPWLLRTLLDAAEARQQTVPRLSLVVSTGAPLTIDDVARTWQWFPNARIRSHYGSTEVAGVGNVDLVPGAALDDPFVMALTVDDDTRVRVLAGGVDVDAGEQGEVWVWSSHAGGRYLDAPDLEQQSTLVDADGNRWFHTGDLGRILPDGRLLVDGRNDMRVKVNGLAVDLTAVATAVARARGRGRRRSVGSAARRRHTARRVDRRRPRRVLVGARPARRARVAASAFHVPARVPRGERDPAAAQRQGRSHGAPRCRGSRDPHRRRCGRARDAERARPGIVVRNRARPEQRRAERIVLRARR